MKALVRRAALVALLASALAGLAGAGAIAAPVPRPGQAAGGLLRGQDEPADAGPAVLAEAELPAGSRYGQGALMSLQRLALAPGEGPGDAAPAAIQGVRLIYVEAGAVTLPGGGVLAAGGQAVLDHEAGGLRNESNACASVLVLTVGFAAGGGGFTEPPSGLPLIPGLDCGQDAQLIGPWGVGSFPAGPVRIGIARARWDRPERLADPAHRGPFGIAVETGRLGFEVPDSGASGVLAAGSSVALPTGAPMTLTVDIGQTGEGLLVYASPAAPPG